MAIQTRKMPLLLGVLVSLHSPLIGKTISGLDYKVQPVVEATDEYGNLDVDYMEGVTLSSKGEGILGGTLSQVAIGGIINYTDINYSAVADNEEYNLIASDMNISDANSGLLMSDVVATKLTFTQEVSPLSFNTGVNNDFTTDPIVKAVNEQGLVDVNFSEVVTLSHNGTGIGSFNNNSITALNGIATFENLTFNYDTTATIELVANDQANITSDLARALSSSLSFEAKTSVNSIVVSVKDNETQWDTTARFDNTNEVEFDDVDGIKTATITVEERTIKVAVVSTGAMQGSVESKDTEGNTVTSSLEVTATNSNTIIDAEGNMNTIVEVDNGSKIKVTVGHDGSIKHEVQTERGLTVVSSTIAGADINVDKRGNITSTSEVEKNGFKYKAIITTNVEGYTQSKFIKVNIATGVEEDISNTLKESLSYDVGSSTSIVEIENLVYIRVETPLNSILVIE